MMTTSNFNIRRVPPPSRWGWVGAGSVLLLALAGAGTRGDESNAPPPADAAHSTNSVAMGTNGVAAPSTASTNAVVAEPTAIAPTAPGLASHEPAPLSDAGYGAEAGRTNAMGNTGTSLDSFRLIAERNIFDQSRAPRSNRYTRTPSTNETRRTPRIESFALVGTMSYEKGNFAFFDSGASKYRKSLKAGDTIGSYEIKEVAPSHVKLQHESKELELKVGQQLRREDEGEWKVSARAESYASSGSSPAGDSASSPAESPASSPSSSQDSGGASEILKRLMQQREKEMNP